jgi:hypothetical protein
VANVVPVAASVAVPRSIVPVSSGRLGNGCVSLPDASLTAPFSGFYQTKALSEARALFWVGRQF